MPEMGTMQQINSEPLRTATVLTPQSQAEQYAREAQQAAAQAAQSATDAQTAAASAQQAAAGAVKYSEAQTLTAAQQAQARANIGAADTAALAAKQDAPAIAGTEGQVLTIDDRGNPVWATPTDAATTWDRIRLDVFKMAPAELAAKYPIGTELVCGYTLGGVKYDCPWVVLDNNRECEWEDGTKHPGLWLGMKYATIEDIQFDAAEGVVITADDETVAEDGYYYCGVRESTYTMLKLAAGAAIPFGDYDTVKKGTINHKDVYQYGYNRYRDTAQRQWLNSDAPADEWWKSTHYGDNAPSQLATRAGFMAGLDEDFLNVIRPVRVQVATNTVTDGGVTDVMYDRFFLQSVEEMYGSPMAAGVEGAYFPYWKEITGLDAPTNGSRSNTNPARQIRRISAPSGSAATVRLRSAGRDRSNIAWYGSTSGYLNTTLSASSSYAAVPACVIS